MIRSELTRADRAGGRGLATPSLMQAKASFWYKVRKWLVPVLLASTAAAGGCVSVNAPDKPIVIELNINIKQEVIYRLAADAGNTIEQNKDIF
ncbi:MAG: YnbE family lipoprotein [Tsuneonella sp.]